MTCCFFSSLVVHLSDNNMSIVFEICDPQTYKLAQQEDEKRHDSLKSFKVRFRAKMLLFSERYSDASFKVGPDDDTAVLIPVHTVFLVAVSDPFDAMFSEN